MGCEAVIKGILKLKFDLGERLIERLTEADRLRAGDFREACVSALVEGLKEYSEADGSAGGSKGPRKVDIE